MGIPGNSGVPQVMQRLGASGDFAELAPDGKQGLTGTPGQMGSLRGWGPQDKHNSRAEPGTDGHPGGQRGCTGGTGNSGRDKQEPPGCVVPWVLSAAYPHFTHWEPTMLAAHQGWAGGLLGACGHQPAVTGVVPLAQSSLCPHCISQWVPSSSVPVCWHRQVHAHPGSSLSQSGTPEWQGTT